MRDLHSVPLFTPSQVSPTRANNCRRTKYLVAALNAMSTNLARVRQVSMTLLRPVWLGREMRRLGRGISRIPLGPIIVAAKTTGTVGSPIPLVQAISSIVVIALQSAQVSPTHSFAYLNIN